jgi:hypothetical protein
MRLNSRHYQLAALCIAAYLLAQIFQLICSVFLMPAPSGADGELLAYLPRAAQVRDLLLIATILAWIVPYAIIALRYRLIAPLPSMLGLIFGAAFIACEISARTFDFFVVGQHWAHELQAAGTDAERLTILHHYSMWNELLAAWYFPLLLTQLLSSCAFALATSREPGFWQHVATLGFALNALRLTGRLLSQFAGQHWLDALNSGAYFPSVLLIGGLLILWFLRLALAAASTNDPIQ